NVRFEPTWLNATSIVEETVKKMEPIAAEKGQTISLEPVPAPDSKLSEEPIQVYADPSMFDTILSNLLENAIKYAGDGANISVSLHCLRNPQHKTSEPLCTIDESGQKIGPGGVVLVVSDTGPGIPPEDLPRIFERFYRSSKDRSRARGGSGLGLSLVRHCVNAHGGKVWAQSKPKERTSFFVWFPDPKD
ncbi:MAG TPA: HAMP domain-containing sensor histidine kinase, partial [Bacillota bacterium]|nr:HAMP domain-containing sensor histidine kinase [Bacillota bacterium]